MKILIIDDVAYMCHVIKRRLEQVGYDVLTETSGTQALKILQQDGAISAVICDLMLKDMLGIEVLKQARKIVHYDNEGIMSPPQFILITHVRIEDHTNQDTADLFNRAMEMGFFDVMLKPINFDYLLAKLTEIKSLNHTSVE